MSQFPLTFRQTQNGFPFHLVAYDYSRADWDGLHDHLRDVLWDAIFTFSASAAASEFCEWVHLYGFQLLVLLP